MGVIVSPFVGAAETIQINSDIGNNCHVISRLVLDLSNTLALLRDIPGYTYHLRCRLHLEHLVVSGRLNSTDPLLTTLQPPVHL